MSSSFLVGTERLAHQLHQTLSQQSKQARRFCGITTHVGELQIALETDRHTQNRLSTVVRTRAYGTARLAASTRADASGHLFPVSQWLLADSTQFDKVRRDLSQASRNRSPPQRAPTRLEPHYQGIWSQYRDGGSWCATATTPRRGDVRQMATATDPASCCDVVVACTPHWKDDHRRLVRCGVAVAHEERRRHERGCAADIGADGIGVIPPAAETQPKPLAPCRSSRTTTVR